jgi:hypothetical protein
MEKIIYSFWLNTKPFRTIWILPLIITAIFIFLMINLGDSNEMDCNWSPRDRWECSHPDSGLKGNSGA